MKVSLSEIDKITLDKYNVAWFKLAEFVGRKEKERALGVYRLLSHSLSDGAFAAQLEGDLFMAFNDEKALDAYGRSARLYEEQGQLAHAALIYEQMIMIRPENREYIIQALKLYEVIKNDAKIARCTSQLARLLIKQGSLEAHAELITSRTYHPEYQLTIQESSVIALIEFQPHRAELIQDYLSCIIRTLESDQAFARRLTLFFAKLSCVSDMWYNFSYNLLKKDICNRLVSSEE